MHLTCCASNLTWMLDIGLETVKSLLLVLLFSSLHLFSSGYFRSLSQCTLFWKTDRRYIVLHDKIVKSQLN